MGARPGENNNGGPKTEAGRQRALANLGVIGKPSGAIVHGMASKFILHCDRCPVSAHCDRHEPGAVCGPELEYMAERRASLLSEVPHLNPLVDGPSIDLLLGLECRIARGLRCLAAMGEFSEGDDLEYRPMMRTLLTLQSLHLRAVDGLSLTPAGRASDLLTRGRQAAELARITALFEDERKDDDDDG